MKIIHVEQNLENKRPSFRLQSWKNSDSVENKSQIEEDSMQTEHIKYNEYFSKGKEILEELELLIQRINIPLTLKFKTLVMSNSSESQALLVRDNEPKIAFDLPKNLSTFEQSSHKANYHSCQS